MSDRKFARRAGAALAVANLRYWSGVAPIVGAQLKRWGAHAEAIPDPCLRQLAVRKLQSEHFNAEVAATLATLAPKAQRKDAVEAIVALEVLYDYLDGLTERPVADPLQSGFQLYRAFVGALESEPRPPEDYYAFQPRGDDGGYLRALSRSVHAAVSRMPAHAAMLEVASQPALRCAEGQIRVHAAPQIGTVQLETWAKARSAGSGLGWREYTAGAVASVLASHALIAVGARSDVTAREARAIDAAYLSISALSTMLDSLVDFERDAAADDAWLVDLYGGPDLLANRLVGVAERAVAEVRALPLGAHHFMTLVGVVAYYASADEARGDLVAPLLEHLRRELRPLFAPTLAVMRAWRLAKRLRDGLGHSEAGHG